MIDIFTLVLIYVRLIPFSFFGEDRHIHMFETALSFIFNYRYKSVLFVTGKTLVKDESFDILFIKLISYFLCIAKKHTKMLSFQKKE